MNESLDIQNLTDALNNTNISIRSGMDQTGAILRILNDITVKDEETGKYTIKDTALLTSISSNNNHNER